MSLLAPHHHSGRFLPHHHTSYSALALILIVTGLILLGIAGQTQIDAASVTISALVHGAPPPAPVITGPPSGQHFSSIPIQVEGTCGPAFKVVLERDGTQSGAGICTDAGTFGIGTDLFSGPNDIVARQYDGLDQASPDSAAITVFLDGPIQPPATPSSPIPTLPTPSQQLLLRSDFGYKVAHTGDQIDWPIAVSGGQAPYAISWDWGDGSVDIISLANPGTYHAKHSYDKPGAYKLIINISDSKSQKGFLQLLSIINGELAPATSSHTTLEGGLLLQSWPLYFLAVIILVSFWLGERLAFIKLKHPSTSH